MMRNTCECLKCYTKSAINATTCIITAAQAATAVSCRGSVTNYKSSLILEPVFMSYRGLIVTPWQGHNRKKKIPNESPVKFVWSDDDFLSVFHWCTAGQINTPSGASQTENVGLGWERWLIKSFLFLHKHTKVRRHTPGQEREAYLNIKPSMLFIHKTYTSQSHERVKY